MRITKAVPADIMRILEIAAECRLSEWSAEQYADELKSKNSELLGISECDSEHLSGFLAARFVPGSAANTLDAEILNIGVAKHQQNQGFGSALLNSFINICKDRKVLNVWLEVRRSNDQAVDFYLKHGFIISATRRNFYCQPDEDGLVMKCTPGRYPGAAD